MRCLLILLGFLIVAPAWSAYITVEGEGRFTNTADDNIGFIKQQLMFKAVQDVYTRELKNLGLDSNLFWKKFDEKFDKYFSSVIPGIREEEKLSNGQSSPEFEKKLRLKRLTMYSKFGRLDRAIVGFSERRSGKVNGAPNTRFLHIAAKVDQQMLNSIYYRFIVDQAERKFSQMLISFEPKLANCNWADLGVENPKDFTQAVESHWLKQIQDELADQVDKIQMATPKDMEEINDYLKTNFALKSSGSFGEGKYQSTVLMTINVQITKNFDEVNDSEREFSFEGYFIVTDLTSSKVIQHFDFPIQKNRLSYAEGQQLGSNIASIIAKLPSLEFNQTKKLLANSVRFNGMVQLSVDRISTIYDYLSFVEFLQARLAGFRPQISHNVFSGEQAVLDVWFEGEQDKVKEAVKALNQQRVAGNVWTSIPDADNPLKITLITKEVVEKAPSEKAQTETQQTE
jgi:hypothetical protein